MANSPITHSWIAKELSVLVKNSLAVANTFYDAYEKEWDSKNGWGVGSTIQIGLPIRYVVGTTASVASGQDSTMLKTSIVATNISNIVMQYTSQEMTTDLDMASFREKHLVPAAQHLASDIEKRAWAQVYKDVFNGGTVGSTPNSIGYITQAGQRLDEMAAPQENRYITWGPAANWSMMGIFGTMQNQQYSGQALSGPTNGRGFGRAFGFEHWMSQHAPTHTCGTITGGIMTMTAVAGQGVVTVASNAIPKGTLTAVVGTGSIPAGATFTIANVYACNPITKANTGQLAQFVCDGVAFVGGSADVIFSPGIIDATASPYKNVWTAAGTGPAASAVCTFTEGTGGNKSLPVSMAYHKRAFAFCTIPLILPESAVVKERQTTDGISVRLVKGWDNLASLETTRVDVLWAVKTIDPSLAYRIHGLQV